MLPDDDARHGTRSGYTRGCRRDCCRKAAAAYENRRRMAKLEGRDLLVDREGAVRRLRSLQAIGWTSAALAAELGRGPSYVTVLLTRNDNDKITASVHHEIDALFRRLCMTPGPSSLTIMRGKAAGWLPPLAYDDIDSDDHYVDKYLSDAGSNNVDHIVVERILNGDMSICKDANALEREEVVAQWATASGSSLADLERRSGWNVTRYLNRVRAKQAA